MLSTLIVVVGIWFEILLASALPFVIQDLHLVNLVGQLLDLAQVRVVGVADRGDLVGLPAADLEGPLLATDDHPEEVARLQVGGELIQLALQVGAEVVLLRELPLHLAAVLIGRTDAVEQIGRL